MNAHSTFLLHPEAPPLHLDGKQGVVTILVSSDAAMALVSLPP